MEPTRYIARGGDVRETIRLGATLVDWRHIAVLRIAPAWLSGYAVVILLVTVLVNLATQLARTAYGLTLPAMRDSLGLSYSQAGSLIAAVSIFLMIASLTFGMLAPRYGSRYIVGASTIVAGVAMVFLGASPSFPIALLTSAAIGFAAGGATTPAMGLLSVWFDARHRGTVAGVAAAGGGMSFIVIGALVPWLTGRDPEDGWRHTWYVLAAVVIVTGIFSLVYLRDAPKEVVGHGKVGGAWPTAAYRSRQVWLIALLAFCSGWGVGLYTTFFGAYLEEQGVGLATSGRLWGLLGLLAIGSGVLWGTLSDRIGRPMGFLLSFATFGAGCLLFWVAPVLAGFTASVLLAGISFRAAYTICAASAGDYVAPRYSAAAFGLMGVGAGLGQAAGPLIGGGIADVTQALKWVFVLATGGAATAAVASMFLRRPRASS